MYAHPALARGLSEHARSYPVVGLDRRLERDERLAAFFTVLAAAQMLLNIMMVISTLVLE